MIIVSTERKALRACILRQENINNDINSNSCPGCVVSHQVVYDLLPINNRSQKRVGNIVIFVYIQWNVQVTMAQWLKASKIFRQIC